MIPSTVELRIRLRNSLVRRSSRSSSRASVTSRKEKIAVSCSERTPIDATDTVMRSPEGEEFPNLGCYLDVVTNERLVWTNALAPGYRPAAQPSSCVPFFFTAVISLEAHARGTKYTGLVMHSDEQHTQQHAAMGFHDGWGTTLDQLVALAKTM